MQYSININQRAVIENGFDLDLLDMAIFDFIIKFSHLDKCVRIQYGGSVYYMISHALVIEQLPMLGIKTSNGILNRINKLIAAGLLERHPNIAQLKKPFYKIGRNAGKIFFSQSTTNEISQPPTNFGDDPQRNLGTTPNENWGYQNNNISVNNITDNSGESEQSTLFPDTTENEKVEKKSKGTRERFCLFENSKFFDIDAFKAALRDETEAGIDVEYYYYAVKDWSASKGAKKYDWIATARNFMRGDADTKRLHTIQDDDNANMIQYLKDMAEL